MRAAPLLVSEGRMTESVMKGERHTSVSRILRSDAISPAYLCVCSGIDVSTLAIQFETLLTSDREPSTLLSFKLEAFTQKNYIIQLFTQFHL